jgi:hypothetical protein
MRVMERRNMMMKRLMWIICLGLRWRMMLRRRMRMMRKVVRI